MSNQRNGSAALDTLPVSVPAGPPSLETAVLDEMIRPFAFAEEGGKGLEELAKTLAEGALGDFRGLVQLTIDFGDAEEVDVLVQVVTRAMRWEGANDTSPLWRLKMGPIVRDLLAARQAKAQQQPALGVGGESPALFPGGES